MVVSKYISFLTPQEEAMPFYLASIGRVAYQTIVHRPLGIEHGQILYTVSGNGGVFIIGITYELKQGQILYLPPNTAHEYHCVGERWETLYITFGGSGLKQFWEFEPSVWRDEERLCFPRWFEILENYKKKPHMEKEISVTLYAMLLEFKEKLLHVSPVEKKKKHILSLAIHEMAKDKALNLEDIAKKVGVSKGYFCRIFKDYTGYRPFEYVNRLKIHRAKELLRDTDLSVQEICLLVGYESHSYFSMLFKKYIGISPSEYRQR